jgi:Glycosyl hydrolase family 1
MEPPASLPAQVEGCTACDGRSVSVWDKYAQAPGVIADGSTASVTNDMYQWVAVSTRLRTCTRGQLQRLCARTAHLWMPPCHTAGPQLRCHCARM